MRKHIKRYFLIMAWALVVPVFIAGQVSFWQGISLKANADDATTLTDEEQATADKLAAEEADRQAEIDKTNDAKDSLENKLKKETAALLKLQQQKAQIGQSVSITQISINKTQSVIKDTVQTISRKEAEVKNLQEKIKLQKTMLIGILQEAYYNQSQPALNMVLSSTNFAEAFSGTDHLLTVGEKLKSISAEISQTKSQIEQDKAELAIEKQKHEEILADKVDQKQELVSDQIEVQGDIEDKNAIIAKLKKQLVELQSDLNSLSGKSYSAKNIRDAVEFASGKIGVPEGVLYGFLKMETNLGANTGKCTYKEVEDVAVPRYKKLLKTNKKWQASIDTLYRRQKLFYTLMDDLNYSKDKKVSCSPAPSSYIGQGGAMGIPQFMSDVWNGYSSRILSATGSKTPDPWDLTDGVMAMAIKLRGAGASSSSTSVIKKASINYLGTFNNNYYSGIVYWSKNYKLLFQ